MAKTSIRRGVFETNSSSVHSITMCSDSDYEKWKRGELVYSWREEKLITLEEKEKLVQEEIEANEKTKLERGENDMFYQICKGASSIEAGGTMHIYFTYEEFQRGDDIYETTFESSFTTDSGEVVHAFGYHGRT